MQPEHPADTAARLARELLKLRGQSEPAQIELGPIPDLPDEEAHAVWVASRLAEMLAGETAERMRSCETTVPD